MKKKEIFIKGDLSIGRDGKVVFVENLNGKLVVNKDTLAPKKQRPWIIRKIHTLLWDWKDTIEWFTLVVMGALLVIPIFMEFMGAGDKDVIISSWRVIFNYINLVLLGVYSIIECVKEPNDQCDC